MRWVFLPSSLMTALILCACHESDPVPVFRQLDGATQRDGMHIFVTNPVIPNAADFPATFYTWTGGFCSSSLVGPRVLLTAAHCVPDGKVKVEIPGHPVRGTCTSAPPPTDIALCTLDGAPASVTYETVNSQSSVLHVLLPIVLSGFGCTLQNGGGPPGHVFGIGLAKISMLPTPGSDDFTTDGDSTLCSGDSGAPAFLVEPAAVEDLRAPGVLNRRLVVGVAAQ